MRRRSFTKAVGSSLATTLAGCLGDPEYTVQAVVKSSPGPLSLSVSIANPNAEIDGPAELVLQLTNPTEDLVRVRNQGIWPFGVLSLARNPGPEAIPILNLYSRAYEHSKHTNVSANRESLEVDGDFLNQALSPGESADTIYHIYGEDVFNDGDFYIVEAFGGPILTYSKDRNANWTAFRPIVRVIIQKRSRPRV